MSTQAQILANQENAKKSHGPVTPDGKETSSQNAFQHGLATKVFGSEEVLLLDEEDPERYRELANRLYADFDPTCEKESLLLRLMVNHEWLRARAQRFQTRCMAVAEMDKPTTQRFALLLRYESFHERSYHKCVHELQKLRNESKNAEIGFVPQMLKLAAEKRAVERHEVFQQRAQTAKPAPQPLTQPMLAPDSSPGALQKAA